MSVVPFETWAWVALAAAGLAAALPFILARYLPMVDLPLHQLELAIWSEARGAATGFRQYYETNSPFLPYWLTHLAAWGLSPVAGIEAAPRLVVFLYALALPPACGLLARACGKSAWWGLLPAPFVFEFNLSFGFLNYCVACLLLLLVVAWTERGGGAATGGAGARRLAALAAACLALGWTHPVVSALAVGSVWFLRALDRRERRAARLAVMAAVLAAAIPTALWIALGGGAADMAIGQLSFASPLELLRSLPAHTIDVFPERIEEVLFACTAGMLAWGWIAAPRPRAAGMGLRLPALAALFVVLSFLAPWDLGGEPICQRMLLPALLLLPALAPPRAAPGAALKGLLVALALVGAANTGLHLRGFDRETAAALDPLAGGTRQGARLAYVPYDAGSRWVNGPAYLHAGAWVALRAGGCYAVHFQRLTSRYAATVPADAPLTGGRGFRFADHYRRTGDLLVVPLRQLPWWDTLLVRWPAGAPRVAPVDPGDDGTVEKIDVRGVWGLFRIAR